MTPEDVLNEFFRLKILPAGGIEIAIFAINDLIMVCADDIEFLDSAAAKLRRSGRFAYTRDRKPENSVLIFEWQPEDEEVDDEQ